MADKSFYRRILSLLLVLATCSTIGLLFFFLHGDAGASSGGHDSFDINVIRGIFGNLNSDELTNDKSHRGLLTSAFDKKSCLSRHQAASYWKVFDHKPSPYLLEKLRAYESLHRKCGPYTELYNKSIEILKSKNTNEHMECSYVVWMPEAGLGNRIISIISSFLYALLTNKVLLLSHGEDFEDLFCEPFPEATWVLPPDFPFSSYKKFYGDRPSQSLVSLLKDGAIDASSIVDGATDAAVLPFAYVHIMHDSSDKVCLFFCDGAQNLLRSTVWVFVRSNNYYAPGLFFISQFQAELDRLFPEKDTVFHHLARYLLHPSDSVWGYITRYYDAYLANANLRLGIQIRNLPFFGSASSADVLTQFLNCTVEENLLPRINFDRSVQNMTQKRVLKAALVVSLNAWYYEKIKDMYQEHSTLDGELIGVYQPSHEERQQKSQRSHNVKALSEMFLLSFSDVLVTSELSTFGYVAQGLGGLKPWVVKTTRKNVEPSCGKAISMEPCFQNPPHCDCKTLQYRDPAFMVPHVRHCEDPWGVKLFH